MRGEISIWVRYSCCKALYKQHFVAVPHTDTHTHAHRIHAVIPFVVVVFFLSFEMFLAIFLLCVAGSSCCFVYPFSSSPSFLFYAKCTVRHTLAHTHCYTHYYTHTLSQWLRTVRFFKWLAAIAFFLLLLFAFYIHCFSMNETAAPKGKQKKGVMSVEWVGRGAWHGQCQVLLQLLLLPDNGVKINTRKCVYNCIIVEVRVGLGGRRNEGKEWTGIAMEVRMRWAIWHTHRQRTMGNFKCFGD